MKNASELKTATTDDEQVGYGKPPKHSRFKKGRTGNRRGAPKKCGNMLAVFKDIVSEKVQIKIGETIRVVTLGEAVLLKNQYEAMRGNQSALFNFLSVAAQTNQLIDEDDVKQVGLPICVPEPMTVEEWVAASERYNLLSEERLRLQEELARRQAAAAPPNSEEETLSK